MTTTLSGCQCEGKLWQAPSFGGNASPRHGSWRLRTPMEVNCIRQDQFRVKKRGWQRRHFGVGHCKIGSVRFSTLCPCQCVWTVCPCFSLAVCMQTFAYLEVYVRVCFFDFLLGIKIWIDENLSKVLCCSFAFFSCSRFPLFGAIILVSLLKDLRTAGLTCCNLRNQGKMIKNTDRTVYIHSSVYVCIRMKDPQN